MSEIGPDFGKVEIKGYFLQCTAVHSSLTNVWLSVYGAMGSVVDGEVKMEAASSRVAVVASNPQYDAQTIQQLEKAKRALFSKFVDLLPKAFEDTDLILVLFSGIRQVMAVHQQLHQDIFRFSAFSA